MTTNTVYMCRNCIYVAHSLKDARKHAKDAGPVWHSGRQTFVSHALIRKMEDSK